MDDENTNEDSVVDEQNVQETNEQSLVNQGTQKVANIRFDMDLYNKESGENIKYKVTLSNFYTEKFVKLEEKTE